LPQKIRLLHGFLGVYSVVIPQQNKGIPLSIESSLLTYVKFTLSPRKMQGKKPFFLTILGWGEETGKLVEIQKELRVQLPFFILSRPPSLSV